MRASCSLCRELQQGQAHRVLGPPQFKLRKVQLLVDLRDKVHVVGVCGASVWRREQWGALQQGQCKRNVPTARIVGLKGIPCAAPVICRNSSLAVLSFMNCWAMMACKKQWR